MIDGVAGVILWTSNMDELIAFYQHTIGLNPHSIKPDFVAFKWGDMRLSIGKHSKISGPNREPYRFMINFSVNDIQETYASLSSKGVEFLRHPEREHWGGWVATFSDPDDNLLQLLEQPKIESQDQVRR